MASSSDHFLALLRFSLGIDREFNFRPTAGEWAQLYEQSLRQSLVGVTYEGVSRLPEDCFEPAASGGADAQTHLPSCWPCSGPTMPRSSPASTTCRTARPHG